MNYNFSKAEKYWQKVWRKEKVYEPNLKGEKSLRQAQGKLLRQAQGKPFYNLMMFPYPSAEGLHVGNMYAFTGSDIYGRFQRMLGRDVFEPIGLDGFGIHSENYALKVGRHPMKQAEISEKNFYRQLEMLGNGFSWNERLETYDPEYYKWTQWIFLQMFRRGLAYRKKQAVNWCPSCKTVLADEQVIAGKCERCSSVVVKKDLEQWFFKITDYAERLLNGLDKIDWSEKIKIAQRNWIGKSEGAEIDFPISDSPAGGQFSVKVFTTRPDTIFGATFLVLCPEHEVISNLNPPVGGQISNLKEVEDYLKKTKAKSEEERIAESKDPSAGSGQGKTGVELKGIKAINPATKEEIPVWAADYVLPGYGTGAIMAVPAHDQRDFEFAKKYRLPIKMVVCPNYPEKTCPILDKAYEGEGNLVDSDKFNGMPSQKAKKEITEFVGGKMKTIYRLRDWLISRQRYWGAPIPLVFCEKCAAEGKGERKEMPGWYGVAEKDLPVRLPFVKNFRPTGTGKSPLASVKSFYETKCPECGGKARRETDVSDTFLDSAWYYLGYLMASKKWKQGITDSRFQKILKRWLPVDMYIGGAEHAVLHLLYVRFMAMVFYDWGLTDFEEPVKKFRAHGLLIKEGAKMSKSKGNVVNPDEYIKKFGADALRMYLMFLAPFEEGGDFRDSGILGITRFLERVWKLYNNPNLQIHPNNTNKISNIKNRELEKLLHQTIKKVTEDIENLRYNTAISALMILLNGFEKNREGISAESGEIFLKLLAPFAPHLSEEIWSRFFVNKKSRIRDLRSKSGRYQFDSIHIQKWPRYDENLAKEKTFVLVIQINGKTRDSVEAKAGISQKEAEAIAFRREKIKNLTEVGKPKKIIYVPDRLINIVYA